MKEFVELSQDYRRIEKAIRYLDEHRAERPDLDRIAKAAHLSPFHFQRLFTRWAGVSPKRFLGYLTLAHARRMLEEGGAVLETSLEVGLSGPSRLHDLFVAFEAMSPGEVKDKGDGLTLAYGFHATPFGEALAAASPRGLCHLAFKTEGFDILADFKARWPKAEFRRDEAATAPLAAAAFGGGDLALHIAGTNFQIKVWEALMRVPPGALVHYQHLGRAIGQERAARAIGNALAANPLAYLIPCHRVIRKTGAFNDYRWGTPRKHAILGWESAHSESARNESAWNESAREAG